MADIDDIPNIQMDEFPDRRPDVDNLDKRLDIETVAPIIQQVVQFLVLKGSHEMREQGKFNQTQLGNVAFHLEYNKITKETRLGFDKHPKAWKIQDIQKDMLNAEADIMMEKEAAHDITGFDNPFTY